MKILKIVIMTFIVMFFSSCDKGGYVDKALSDSYFYSSDKNKIWYKKRNAPDVSALWDYDWIEVAADAKSFKVMKGGYGKDNKNIFFGSRIIENVDYKTFQKIDSSRNYMDFEHVYLSDLKILKDADPNTYQVIKSAPTYYSINQPIYYWAKDDKHFFYKDSALQVDYNSFKVLNAGIMVDDYFIYAIYNREFSTIPNKTGTSEGLTALSNNMVFSNYFLYFKYYATNNEKGFKEMAIKDKNSIREYGFGNYFTVDGKVYYEMKVMEAADPNTFETFIEKWKSDIAKDKNYFYVRDKIVPDINPKDVFYDAENDAFSYLGKLWNSETERFDKNKTEK